MLGLFLPPKINFFRSFFEVPISYRFWSVLGGFGESLGRVWGEFWEGLERVWGGFGEGLGRVWEGFGDEILKPLAKRGTAGGLRSALRRPTVGGAACWILNQLGFVKYWPISMKPNWSSSKSRPRPRITPSLSLPRASHIPPGRPKISVRPPADALFFDFLAFQKML